MISEVDLRDWGTYPTQPITSKEQYEHYLKNFDWFYDWSDDHQVWKRGHKGYAYLIEARAIFDKDHINWTYYKP